MRYPEKSAYRVGDKHVLVGRTLSDRFLRDACNRESDVMRGNRDAPRIVTAAQHYKLWPVARLRQLHSLDQQFIVDANICLPVGEDGNLRVPNVFGIDPMRRHSEFPTPAQACGLFDDCLIAQDVAYRENFVPSVKIGSGFAEFVLEQSQRGREVKGFTFPRIIHRTEAKLISTEERSSRIFLKQNICVITECLVEQCWIVEQLLICSIEYDSFIDQLAAIVLHDGYGIRDTKLQKRKIAWLCELIFRQLVPSSYQVHSETVIL